MISSQEDNIISLQFAYPMASFEIFRIQSTNIHHLIQDTWTFYIAQLFLFSWHVCRPFARVQGASLMQWISHVEIWRYKNAMHRNALEEVCFSLPHKCRNIGAVAAESFVYMYSGPFGLMQAWLGSLHITQSISTVAKSKGHEATAVYQSHG